MLVRFAQCLIEGAERSGVESFSGTVENESQGEGILTQGHRLYTIPPPHGGERVECELGVRGAIDHVAASFRYDTQYPLTSTLGPLWLAPIVSTGCLMFQRKEGDGSVHEPGHSVQGCTVVRSKSLLLDKDKARRPIALES